MSEDDTLKALTRIPFLELRTKLINESPYIMNERWQEAMIEHGWTTSEYREACIKHGFSKKSDFEDY